MFLAWYGQQSCTAGRAAFITGQSPIRTGLTKVGLPGSNIGLSAKDPSVADVLKSLGYATGQFGKNHLGDRNEFLPCVHGFDVFSGICITLTPRKSQKTLIIQKTRSSKRNLDRVGF